jgi:predicted secreted protein
MMMRKLKVVNSFFWIAALVLPAVSLADSEQVRDQVSFQVEVGRDVENDRVIAILNVTAEALKPAKLADTINSTMSWAVEQASVNQEVKSRSGAYQTYPVYEDKKIVRWRGRQELQLESQDVDALSELVGTLQSRLQMHSLQFSVSPHKRRQVEEELTEQALKAFQQRAELIRKSLDAQSYMLIEVNVHTAGQDRPIPIVRAEAASMMSRSSVKPPAMEQGTSHVSVQASGKIRLLRD